MIHMDSLTKVYNRKGLFDAIIPLSHLAQRNHFSVGVMMVDIDRFKQVNDTYGHQTGDEVLEIVAQTLKSNIRASDIVGRYGGEEFLLFFSPVEKDSLEKIAHQLHNKVEVECCKSVPVTISIGVAYGYIEKDVEEGLQRWISNYVLMDDNASQEQKAKKPLREASVEVTEVAGRPGWYEAVMRLRPHYQLEGLRVALRLVTKLDHPSKE